MKRKIAVKLPILVIIAFFHVSLNATLIFPFILILFGLKKANAFMNALCINYMELFDDNQIKIKEIMRYFIVFYIATGEEGQVAGSVTFTSDGCYLSLTESIRQIHEIVKIKTRDIVPTNIIELNESDYNDWNRTKIEKPIKPPLRTQEV